MAMGLVAGLLLVVVSGVHRLGALPWLILHVVLVGPTALQPWLQWKPYKITARTLLGVGTTTWLIGSFLAARTKTIPHGFEIVVSILVFMTMARLLWWLRERRSLSPCTKCDLGSYPTCTWNLPRLLAEADPELGASLVQSIEAGAVYTAVPPREVDDVADLSRTPTTCPSGALPCRDETTC
jgi:hypothetical protein